MLFAGIKFLFIAVCISLSLYYAHDLIKTGYNGWGWFIFIAFVLATEMPSAENLYKTKKKVLDMEDED